MTYLVENEQAALVIPARLLARVHPHFREVQQLLAVQAADEARHMEVFTRRALLHGAEMGTSSVGGRASLATLLAEPDFSLASFLLSVLGEGSFLDAARVPRRARARPGHPRRSPGWRASTRPGTSRSAWRTCEHQAGARPHAARHGCARAIERRHDALVDTAGLNADVFDALVVLAAGRVDARRRSPAATARCRTCTTRWTTAAGNAWPASASRPTRRPSCPPCTPATSCEEFELVPYWYPTTAHLHCIQPTGGRMIWFAIALVLFACGGVALWLSRAPRRPEPRPIPHDEPENLFEPRSSREDPSP